MSLFSKSICFALLGIFAGTLFAGSKCPDIPASTGQCISVGKYQLFMATQGQAGPLVVFENGRGNTVDTWSQVVPLVSQFARTVTYDRANLGYSQNLVDPKIAFTAEKIARDLHEMLHTAKLSPPYILVGHSDGGMYVQMFARLYPKEVSGVVLVDSASADQEMAGPLPSPKNSAYPESLGFSTSQKEIKAAPPFPAVPLIVLTASYHGSKDPNTIFHMVSSDNKPISMTEGVDQALWIGYQNQLAKLSPYSTHLYAYGSDHFIQKFQPNLVVDAIYTLVVSK